MVALAKLNAGWSHVSITLFRNYIIFYIGFDVSLLNLSFITLERYVKIVHNSFHRKYYRTWMTCMIIASTWILSSGLSTVGLLTDNSLAYNVFRIVFCWCPLLVIIFCYRRIIIVIRRSARQFENTKHTLAQIHQRNQLATIKTTSIIITLFVVCSSPYQISSILADFSPRVLYGVSEVTSQVSMFLGFLGFAIHPFVYGARVNFCRNFVKRMMARFENSGMWVEWFISNGL